MAMDATWIVRPNSRVSSRSQSQDLSRQPSVSSITSVRQYHKPVFQWVRGKLIGKGSYGRVYLGMNATSGAIMAVKQVEKPTTRSDLIDSRQKEVIEALKEESATLSDLEHPNIVQYLGWEESEEYLSIFLEYVPGGTISSCLVNRGGGFSEELVKSFTEQILAGLEYLHARGILHRDLKSENILVEPAGICKISDFGISKRLSSAMDEAKAFTELRGTLFWMAPEVVDSKKMGYDSKVDIWSVGCVTLEMWTGERPWSGQQQIPVMVKLYKDKAAPPLPPGLQLTPLADDFRMKCFAVDPKLRPSASELRQHPYLIPNKHWKFTRAEIESAPIQVSTSRVPDADSTLLPNPYDDLATPTQDSTVTMQHRWNQGVPRIDTSVPPVHGSSQPRPRPDTVRPMQRNPVPARSINGSGPTLVTIPPPSSPAPARNTPISPEQTRQSPVNISPSALSRAGKKIKRPLFVANPDPEAPEPRPYHYTPPPLPSTLSPETPRTYRPGDFLSTRVGRDARLDKDPRRMVSSSDLRQEALTSPYTTKNAKFAASSDQIHNEEDDAVAPRHAPRPSVSLGPTIHVPASSSSYDSNDDDSDDDSGTIWKRPPIDLVESAMTPIARQPPIINANVNVNPRKTRMSIFQRPRQTTLPRPDIEDVYDHLQEAFPGHNLDEPVVDQDRNLAARKKSIRMVAQEQARHMDRLSRRGTKMWGGRAQELHA